jgi:hypothetical protein
MTTKKAGNGLVEATFLSKIGESFRQFWRAGAEVEEDVP